MQQKKTSSNRRSPHPCLTTAVLAALWGCGGGPSPSASQLDAPDAGFVADAGQPGSERKRPTEPVTDAGMPPIDDPTQYLDSLPPAANDVVEPDNRAVGGATFEHSDERVCSTTRYEVQSAPDEVVMFNADPQVFWPGALLQGDSYATGSPKLIPLPGRAKLNLSVSGLFARDSSAFDVTPSQSAVNMAIGALLSGALLDDIPATQSVSFRQQEAYSFEQAALSLGFSARYLGAKVKGSLSYRTSAEQNTVAAHATIRTFTISVDQPPTPSAFFDGLDPADLEAQVALGRLSEDNPPVYVASVTYGQIMMFSASSSASMAALKGALSASFNSFAGGGSAGLSAAQTELLQAAQIQVVTLGGSEEGVATLIQQGDPASFFKGSTVVTSSVPIAYTLKDLHGNIVQLGETARYDLTTCNPNGFANFYVGNQGSGEALGYYADGSEAELAEAIVDPHHPILDMAVDSANNRLYVLHQDGAGSREAFLRTYEANGQRPEPGALDGSNELFLSGDERGLTYDGQNARLYLAGSYGGCEEQTFGVVRARTLAGAELATCFDVPYPDDVSGDPAIVGHAAVYAARRDRLYVAVTYNGVDGPYGRIEVFDKRGHRLTEADAFPGLQAPTAVAYDEERERVYVAERAHDRVHVFDWSGTPISLPVPFPRFAGPSDLLVDSRYDRLYVVEQDASLISAFTPDGSEAAGLTSPVFPGLNRPVAITLRP